ARQGREPGARRFLAAVERPEPDWLPGNPRWGAHAGAYRGLSLAALCRSAAERLWMRPKPATKRASRGVIFQKEKSASSKLIACSGKRASQASFGPPESCTASPRMLTRISV